MSASPHDPILKEYQAGLDRYTQEDWDYKANEHTWSLGQMYAHILHATWLAAKCIFICVGQKEKSMKTSKGPKLSGRYILLTGSFPPYKTKVPRSVELRTPQYSMQDARERIQELQQMLDRAREIIPDADLSYKMRHPVIGYLHALNWYRFILAHMRHHLKQKKRLQAHLKNGHVHGGGLGIILFCCISLGTSCSNDAIPEPEPVCDTVGITFESKVKAIMTTNCAFSGCHDGSIASQGDFRDYAQLKARVDDGSFNRKALDPNTRTMPPSNSPGPKSLTKCQLQELKTWVAQGAIEN